MWLMRQVMVGKDGQLVLLPIQDGGKKSQGWTLNWKMIWIGWDFVNLEMDIKLANPLPFD